MEISKFSTFHLISKLQKSIYASTSTGILVYPLTHLIQFGWKYIHYLLLQCTRSTLPVFPKWGNRNPSKHIRLIILLHQFSMQFANVLQITTTYFILIFFYFAVMYTNELLVHGQLGKQNLAVKQSNPMLEKLETFQNCNYEIAKTLFNVYQ